MGSFNVACSASNLSINCGDPVAYIPLTKTQYPSYQIGDKNNMLIYSDCFYEPLTLPIFGTYDDYGSIDPNDDVNTELLKKKGFDLKALLDPMSNTDDDDVHSGMFVHGEIYDTIRDECSTIDDLGKECSTRKTWEGYYDDFLKALDKARKLTEKYKGYTERQPEVNWMEVYMVDNDHNIFNFRRWHKFRKIYDWAVVEQCILKKELIDFVMFTLGFYAINRFFFPAMNGYQFGNPYATTILSQRIFQISSSKERRYD